MFSRSQLEFALRFFALGRSLFGQRAVKDTHLWKGPRGRLSVAWVMSPTSLANLLGDGSDDKEPVRSTGVDFWIRRTFEGISRTDFGYGGTIGVHDLLSRLSNTLWDPDLVGEQDDPPFLTIIPEGGWPWPAKDDVYFSAKSKKMTRSERPDWLIKVPKERSSEGSSTTEDEYGIDFCSLLSADTIDGVCDGLGDAVIARLPGEEVMVTHVVSPKSEGTLHDPSHVKSWSDAGRSVRSCGGFLFPSLAIGPVPATNFGSCVLVAHLGVALQGVKPYKPRGKNIAWLYDTDAWTGTVGNYAKGWAAAAFRQMHGHSDYMWNEDSHVWLLGTPESVSALGGMLLPRTIDTVAKLNSELKRRFSVWKRGMTPEGVLKVQDKVASTNARYPYLEAKSNGITPMDAYPIALCPRQDEKKFSAFLDAAGWEGKLISMRVPDEIYLAMQDYDWLSARVPSGTPNANRVKESIRAWAQIEFGWNVADEVRKIGRAVSIGT